MTPLFPKILLLFLLLTLSTSSSNETSENPSEKASEPSETPKTPENSENLEQTEDDDTLEDDDDDLNFKNSNNTDDYNFNDSDYNFNDSDYNYNDSDLNVSDYDDPYDYDPYNDDPYGDYGDYYKGGENYDSGYNYEDEQKKSVCCSIIVQEAMKNNRQQLKDVINRIKKAKSKVVIEKVKSDLSHLCVEKIKKETVDKYMSFYETANEIELEESDKELIDLDYNKYKTEADLASDYSVENTVDDIRDAENNFIETHPKFKRLFAPKKNNDEMEIDPKYKNRAFLMVVGVIAVTVLCMFGNLYVERNSVKEKEN